MIIIPIFIMQLIHVRVYSVYSCLLLTTTRDQHNSPRRIGVLVRDD